MTHGFHLTSFSLRSEPRDNVSLTSRSPLQRGEAVVTKIREAHEWATQFMTLAQQIQEGYANKIRNSVSQYRVNDKIWLNLKNHIRLSRVTKKFDWKNAKYTITKVLSSHAVRLDIPGDAYSLFHIDLLRPAATDPRSSQVVPDPQPEPIVINGAKEWEIKHVVAEHTIDKKRHYAVKWIGYSEIIWKSEKYLADAAILNIWKNMSDDERQKLRRRIHIRLFTLPKKWGRSRKKWSSYLEEERE